MTKRCRIVYLITELNIGGAENSLYQLVTHINPQKFLPVVCSLSGEGKIADKLRDKGIKVICLGAKHKFDFSIFFKLLKFLRREKPRILHTYLFHANFLGRIAGRIVGIPIIVSSVRVAEKEKKYHLYLDAITQWMVDREVCVSKEVEKFMAEKAKISSSKLITIYNGITPSDFSLFSEQEKNTRKKELRVNDFTQIIGTVSRLSKQKGLQYLLKAFQIILKDFPNACLLIIGSGEQEKRLKNMAEKLNITPSVKFLGFREDAIDIINIMDVFVLSSLWEGMPNVVLEAYALGKPVVSTRVGGAAERSQHGETGFLVPAGDSEGLSNTIKLLLKNSGMREEFGRKGKDFVLKNFSLDKMVKDSEKIYEDLISKFL